jgi:molybdopterin/thiamine biosynthesis adenylyltransferase
MTIEFIRSSRRIVLFGHSEEIAMEKQASSLRIIECTALPEILAPGSAYRLLPQDVGEKYYRERTDRNIGWITEEEQQTLRRSVVGIAGCGGMGGLVASILVRLGVGEVRIADNEIFDASNINRQFAATRRSIGKSKARETARMLREVSDDATLVVYPQGIDETSVVHFLDGCDVVCDEIEFWAVGARLLLHKEARAQCISVFNCSTIGFGTRLFLFEPDGYTMEEQLGLSLAQAMELQRKIQSKAASAADIKLVMDAVIKGLIVELPEYSADTAMHSTVEAGLKRLAEEGRAPIIGTNPPMASGFLADHVLFYLLRDSVVERNVVRPVEAPGYLSFDAGFLEAKSVAR